MAEFQLGDFVRVLDRDETRHHRVPVYIRNHTGRVMAKCGRWPRPENVAYGIYDGPTEDLYQVEFRQEIVWPRYAGSPGDVMWVDIHSHWLTLGDEKDA